MNIQELLQRSVEQNASDIFIIAGYHKSLSSNAYVRRKKTSS